MKKLLLASLCLGLIVPLGAEAHRWSWHKYSKKQTVVTKNPDGIFDPSSFGFSHVAIGRGKRVAYISGQSGEDSQGNYVADFDLQAERTYEHLKIALDSINAKPNQVAKITTYIVDYDLGKLGSATAALQNFFGDHRPAQTLVPVPRLALDGMLIEVDAVVILGN